MKFDLKIGHREFTITEKDRVLFNGASYILLTQEYFSNYHYVLPTLSKQKSQKWIKEGKMIEAGKRTIGKTTYPVYKFVKEI